MGCGSSAVAILVVCDRGGCFGSGMALAGFRGCASCSSLADAGRAQTPSKNKAGSIQLAARPNLMVMRRFFARLVSVHRWFKDSDNGPRHQSFLTHPLGF
jgi:hypothetical protein